MGRSLRERPARTWLVGAVTVCALSGAAALASSQIELGVIQGVVTDEHGKPLEGVTFVIRDLGRGREFTITSDEDGRFYRRGLPAVEYEIRVEKNGYQPIRDKVRLMAGTDRRFTFKLARASPEGSEEFVRGVAAFNKGDVTAAAAAFEAARERAPGAAEVRVNLALAYLRLGRSADAVAELEHAASLGMTDPKIQYQLGSAYIELKAYDKAVEAFEKGLASSPDLTTDTLAVEAMSTLGAVYFAQGHNDKAAAAFEKVLAAKPGAAGATLGMGKVHFSKGEIERAIQLFDRVVKQHPGTPEAAQAETFLKELRKPGTAHRL